MKPLKPKQSVLVHAYKHNGTIYRSWEKVVVFYEDEERLVLINEEVLVTEINGKKWKTNEPAMWFFFKNEWYNIICMFKEKGLNFYCNVASPYYVEDQTIKYIDYDLDIKIYNDFSYKILDLKEFNRNRMSWNYSKQLVDTIWSSIDKLKSKIKKRDEIFNHDLIKELWDKYKDN